MDLNARRRLFENPTHEFRGKPFWSWNGDLKEDELLRQIDVMKQMGFGGYFMHSRTGLETEYLGEEWFRLINSCADYGQQAGMESWLYDEDRWPSGSAGGMVTQEEKYRAMFMEMNLLTPEQWGDYTFGDHTAGVFALALQDGIFSKKRALKAGDALESGETCVEFHIRYSECNENYNGYCYVNTMHREAVEKYLEITHERYREKCGERLGKEILGVFTDEPHRGAVFTNFAEGRENAAPYTPDLFEQFEARFGYSLRENLPELFLRTREDDLSRVKRDYFELCQQLFLERFAVPVLEWCRDHKLLFTGHVLHEDCLCAQSIMQGSLMRFYEYMDYPGIDLLGEKTDCYWIAKQVMSVARQMGQKWVLTELYGCTGWQMNFESYKNVGDWQALMGVNLRSPHLSWYTMKGEAKRDYPASIFHQSPWHRDFSYVEDYFSRIHAALFDAKPLCNLLVISPIESVWARAYVGAFAWLNAKDPEIVRLEEQYAYVFRALMGHQIDFDYGDEDILARRAHIENGVLHIGNSSYKKVLVAGVDTMRTSTLALLKEFTAQGGEVVFAGAAPEYLDAQPSTEIAQFADACTCVPFETDAISSACRTGCEVTVISEGQNKLYAQVYRVAGGRMVMLLNTDRDAGYEDIRICLGKGTALEQWDPRSGGMFEPNYTVESGEIHLTVCIEKGGERIYFIPDEKQLLEKAAEFAGTEPIELPERFRYHLTERNICVLDTVSVCDGKEISLPAMEVLKADRALRDTLKRSWRGGEMLQPWYQIKYKGGNTELLATLTLRYSFDVEALPGNTALVVESLDQIRSVRVNGNDVPLVSVGKWIDVCFDELAIPAAAFIKGQNEIEIVVDYYPTSGFEAIYLLGDFGVRTDAGRATLTTLPETLTIGDVTPQGLPFYSGGIVYKIDGPKDKEVSVCADRFGGALVKLHGDGEAVIAFPPYRASIRNLTGIEVVLTRRNTFGPLHQIPLRAPAYSPGSFVTEGNHWSDDYMLFEQGLLDMPEIKM